MRVPQEQLHSLNQLAFKHTPPVRQFQSRASSAGTIPKLDDKASLFTHQLKKVQDSLCQYQTLPRYYLTPSHSNFTQIQNATATTSSQSSTEFKAYARPLNLPFYNPIKIDTAAFMALRQMQHQFLEQTAPLRAPLALATYLQNI